MDTLTLPESLSNSLGSLSESSKLTVLRQTENELCKHDALYWAQTWTKTENPHYLQQGLEFCAPFPKKEYFKTVFTYLASERRLFICKSREMLSSWCVMIFAMHQSQWFKAEVVVQTDSEDKAKELVSYAECLYRNQAPWLKAMHPLKTHATSLTLEWADGGRIFGIPHGQNKLRLYHPTIVIFDEASFLPEFEECYNVAQPVAKKIIAISSAGPGAFADQCSY